MRREHALVWGVCLSLLAAAAVPSVHAARIADGRVVATTNATTLVKALVDTQTFDLLAARYTGNQPSGVITWNNTLPTWNRHLMHDSNRHPSGAVFFSTGGNMSHAIHVTGFNDKNLGAAAYQDYVSDKISNSRDAKILDFTLRAKVDGYVSVRYSFVSNEYNPVGGDYTKPLRLTSTGKKYNDAFHFEINGTHKAVLFTNALTGMEALLSLGDVATYHFSNRTEWTGVSTLDTVPTRMVKGQVYRFKIRMADRWDRAVDSAAYVDRGGVRIVPYRTCSSSSPCPSGSTCCGGVCCKNTQNYMSLLCCGGTCCYTEPLDAGEYRRYQCGIDALVPTRKICCSIGAFFEKDGKGICCPPGYRVLNGGCTPSYPF